MEPAFALRIVATAVDMFVEHMCVVPVEPPDFLLEPKASVFHELGIAPVPEVTVPLDRTRYPVADRLDDMFVQDFAIKRR